MPSLALIRRSEKRTTGRARTNANDATADAEDSSPVKPKKSKSSGSKLFSFGLPSLTGGSNVSTDRTLPKLEDDSKVWAPSAYTAFKVLMSIRLSAAIWTNISDCDEVYNYWEPLHLFLNGSGFQTWEYSPDYAIRSYFYILLHYAPAKLYQLVLPHSQVTTFYFTRCFLGFCSTMSEIYFYQAVCEKWSRSVGRIFFAFLLLSAGMFSASVAFLPSSFTMVLNMLSLALWLRRQLFLATLATAFSALVGWPFAAILGLPIVLELVFQRRDLLGFLSNAIVSGIVTTALLVHFDSHYYGSVTLAPLNIVLYNVFSQHGPSLYGKEPLKFYLVNGLLNFNVIFPLALAVLPITVFMFWYRYSSKRSWCVLLPTLYVISSLYLWLLVFFSQPHKEERFLFPVYPLFCLCAAVTLDSVHKIVTASNDSRIQRFLNRLTDFSEFSQMVSIALVAMFSVARVIALYRNYHAPFDVYMDLSEKGLPSLLKSDQYDELGARIKMKPKDLGNINVCVSKEWYRFPGSFFLPASNWHLQFVKSEFSGLLPKPYANLPLTQATRLVPSSMNDQNKEEFDRYIDVENCDFLIDFSDGSKTDLEPDYARDWNHWKVMSEKPFLIASKSNPIFGAFFVPFLSDEFCEFGIYVLLKRIK